MSMQLAINNNISIGMQKKMQLNAKTRTKTKLNMSMLKHSRSRTGARVFTAMVQMDTGMSMKRTWRWIYRR